VINHSSPSITELEKRFVCNVLDSGLLTKGPNYKMFLGELEKFVSCKHCILLSSGTSSLLAILDTINKIDGLDKDEIILPTYVCKSVADAITSSGFKPVFCDVGHNWVMNSKSVAEKITKKTKAIIIVNIFGIIVDCREFKKFDCLLIEDNCQSFYKSDSKFADFSFYSFHATKCMTTAEGGLAVCHNNNYSDMFFNSSQNLEHTNGINEINSALGLAQLERYDEMLLKRNRIAAIYLEHIDCNLVSEIQKIDKTIYYRFPLRKKNNESFESIKNEFEHNGVAVRKGVDMLLHRLYGYGDKCFGVAKLLFDETISIPIYPSLTLDEARYISTLANRILV